MMAPAQVWVKPLADGSKAVILWNRGTEENTLTARWEDVGLFPGTKAVVRDLWKKAEVGVVLLYATRRKSSPTAS